MKTKFIFLLLILLGTGYIQSFSQSSGDCPVTRDQVVRYMAGQTDEENSKIWEEAMEMRNTGQLNTGGGGGAATISLGGTVVGFDGTAMNKTEYDVVIISWGASKLNVVKVVKSITGLGLKESKAIVDNAPNGIVKENVSKEEAEDIKKQLEEAGAEVKLK